ncbi:MAG: cyclic nucleotide-binding domain-containing protein [Actinobacteria bacterium]|nr:cyclic nucleotide-binding domain-containing protein [Actinomycetota bacterium]
MDASELRAIPMFAGLSEADRRAIAGWADELTVEEGKHLVDEGRFAYEFFVIVEGSAEVRRADRVLGTLGPGDFFGELGLLGEGGTRTASVVATSPLRVIVMLNRDFAAMDRAMPAVAKRIRAACYDDLPPD